MVDEFKSTYPKNKRNYRRKLIMKKTIVLSILFLFVLVSAHAQDNNQVEMADALYANGKIYVVAIVASIVIAILTAYVIMIDRKVTKLEEKINQK